MCTRLVISFPPGANGGLKRAHGGQILSEIYVVDHWDDFQDSKPYQTPGS